MSTNTRKAIASFVILLIFSCVALSAAALMAVSLQRGAVRLLEMSSPGSSPGFEWDDLELVGGQFLYQGPQYVGEFDVSKSDETSFGSYQIEGALANTNYPVVLISEKQGAEPGDRIRARVVFFNSAPSGVPVFIVIQILKVTEVPDANTT